jgi:hypothetical protein
MSDENQKSRIIIEFDNINSSIPRLLIENVNASQLFAAAKIIELYGENTFIQDQQRRAQEQAMKQIAVPKGVMPKMPQ